jgi:hypothetical protein
VDLNSNSRYRTWRSQISGLATPADADDAATKGYVDNGIAGMNTLATGKVSWKLE